MRIAAGLVLLLTAVGAPAALGAASKRVDVGGYKLFLHCVGEGSPVVVLDSGAGDSSAVWEWVIPGIRPSTRVCIYDRAGLGKSEPGPIPRTSDRIVVELKALLARAGVRPPYVLGGHSFGGLNVRLYAALHPDEVVGVVLIDATPEDFPKRDASLRTRNENEKIMTARSIASPAARAEVEGMVESAAVVREAGTVTAEVIVLTADHPEGSPAFQSAWKEMQTAMVKSFPHARQIVAERSGHYIQYDRPELIVDAVKELVNSARRSAP
jgi:pimeloyl-ACP methyl ester carboxylesterase